MAGGAKVASSPAELAGACEAVITILTDGAAIDAVYNGSNGLLSGDVKGKLFVALAGESFDGHEFVARAVRAGATAALVSRAWADEHLDAPLPLLVVDDPLMSLQRSAGICSDTRNRFARRL